MAAKCPQQNRLWARYRGDLAFRGTGVVELLVVAVPLNTGPSLRLRVSSERDPMAGIRMLDLSLLKFPL